MDTGSVPNRFLRFACFSTITLKHHSHECDLDASPELSDYGRMQIEEVVETLKQIETQEGVKIDRIISSPLIRCVQTSDLVAEGLNVETISIEHGLMEEAKSFRGHPPNEPAPVWDPLVLPREQLKSYSSRVKDETYNSMTINHELDFSCTKNGVREVHQLDPAIRDPIQVTSCRCLKLIEHLERNLDQDPTVNNVLLVSHYAIVKGIAAQLHEGGLGGHMKVGSFGGFRRVDPSPAAALGVEAEAKHGASGDEDSKGNVMVSSSTSQERLRNRWAPVTPQWITTKRVPPRPR